MTKTERLPAPDVLERERLCLELRRAGLTFDVIAERVGYTAKQNAHRAYKRALARTLPLTSTEAFALELDRLERLHAAVWPAALRGDLGAIDRVLRIAAVRAALMNPARIAAETPTGDLIDELTARRAARRQALG